MISDLDALTSKRSGVMSTKRNIATVLSALKACGLSWDVKRLRRIHAETILSGDVSHMYVESSLVSMYAKCGSLVDACNVFDKMVYRDTVAWNGLIMGHEENGKSAMALELYEQMTIETAPNSRTYVATLKACASLATEEQGKLVSGKLVKVIALEKGLKIHSRAAANGGFDADMFFSNTLVDMYAKCGSMLDARRVFDKMSHYDVVSWTALILGYSENGAGDLALLIFAGMLQKPFQDCPPNALTFVAAVKACSGVASTEQGSKVGTRQLVKLGALEKGMELHSLIINCGYELDILVANTLMDMYAKCGSLLDARVVFDRMPCQSVVSWTVMMLAYAEAGQADLAWELFSRMKAEGFAPNARSYVAALKACSCLAAGEDGQQVDGQLLKIESLRKGRLVHLQAVESCCLSDIFVANTLLDMYANCGSIVDARDVFYRMPRRSVVSWNAIILGCSENGEGEVALSMFQQMQRCSDCLPDSLTFVAALKACSSLAVEEESKKVDGTYLKLSSLARGIEVHSQAIAAGYGKDILVANTLVDMYGKCGSMADARKVFDSMSERTLVSWTVLMLGYAENGEPELALELFQDLRRQGLVPDALAFVAALKACASLAGKEDVDEAIHKHVKQSSSPLQKGEEIHRQAAEAGYEGDQFVANSLVDMYAKCGSLEKACSVFNGMSHRSLVSWNTMILGYVDGSQEHAALDLFEEMVFQGCRADTRTFVAALKACTCLAAKEEGLQIDKRLVKMESLAKGMAIHSQAAAAKTDCDMFVSNALLDMYCKCGSLIDAATVFSRMPRHDVVSWTSFILGCVENGEAELSLDLYTSMEAAGCKPNVQNLMAALKACAAIAALEAGRFIHAMVCRGGFEADPVVETCLLDLYGKCGSMFEAQAIFDSSRNNPVTWNALIAGYSRNGESNQAVKWFNRMVEEARPVNSVTFVSLLAACSHAGLIEQGRRYFDAMWPKFGVRPGIEHYHCLIDMLCRGDRMEEAMGLVESMRHCCCEPSHFTWTIILSGSSKWKNEATGKLAFDALQQKGFTAAAFTLMSNMYVS